MHFQIGLSSRYTRKVQYLALVIVAILTTKENSLRLTLTIADYLFSRRQEIGITLV